MMAPQTRRVRARPKIDLSSDFQAGFEHHQAGRLEEAEVLYREILKKTPDHFDALHLLGVVAHQRGREEEAVELISRALALSPNVAEAHLNLGSALRGLERLNEAAASYRRAIALQPNFGQAFCNLSTIQNTQGDFEAALENAERARALMPELPEALLNRAAALNSLRRFKEAEAAYRQALALQPNRADIHSNLALVLLELQRLEEAIALHQRAIELEPNSPMAHFLFGGTLLYLGDVGAAEARCRRAIALDPNFARGWGGLGQVLRGLGRFDEARSCFRRALELDPNVPHPYAGLAILGQPAGNELELGPLRALVERRDQPALTRIDAGFALGMLLDNAGRYDEAFPHFIEANAGFRDMLVAAGEAFDPAWLRERVDGLIAVCTPDFFSAVGREGNPSEIPVFIVGLPRSGTSLVEQIAATHSRVSGAGETKEIMRIADIVQAHAQGHEMDELDPDLARRLADEHVEYLQNRGGGAARVTDKMPDNLFHLGLIAVLYPNARVIFVRRDLRDVCLSCFIRRFDDAIPWAYDLVDCGIRALESDRLADHWRRALPLRMLTIDYEALVADLEGESRRLIDFLGLDWEPACLEFHKTDRPVLSASGWQVRQPLFDRSIGRWRHYERHLGPLLEVLERCGAIR